jgi:uncharacterized membrane protein
VLEGVLAPLDINNMGRFVGVGGASGTSGVIYDQNDNLQDEFDPLGSHWTLVFGINESGHVVGCYLDSIWRWHGFLRYPDRTLRDISFPRAINSCAYGINDSNQIVGYWESGNGSYHSYVDLSR